MISINHDLIKESYNGLYLNPRFTFGWNDQLINRIDHADSYDNLQDFIECIMTDEPQEVQAWLKQLGPTPMPRRLAHAVDQYMPVYGQGHDGKSALNSANRHFSKLYQRVFKNSPNTYENLPALKWDYLASPDLGIYKINDPIHHYHVVVLGLG